MCLPLQPSQFIASPVLPVSMILRIISLSCNISKCTGSSVVRIWPSSPSHLPFPPFSLPPLLSISLPSPSLSQAGQLSSVEEVTEKVAVAKALEPDHYALYMVLGDAVSGVYVLSARHTQHSSCSPHLSPAHHPNTLDPPLSSPSERFLHPTEGILQVIQDCRTDHYLCIKPNTLHLVLRDHVSSPSVCDLRVCVFVRVCVCMCVCPWMPMTAGCVSILQCTVHAYTANTCTYVRTLCTLLLIICNIVD